MNREIKFRAWDELYNKMVYSDKVNGLMGFFHAVEQRTKTPPVMQYTGLKDKNGKEIWEGDVWENEIHEFIVQFGDYEYGYYGDEHDRVDEDAENVPHCGWYVSLIPEDGIAGGEKYPLAPGTDGQVIGNIYENPDLLPAIKSIE